MEYEKSRKISDAEARSLYEKEVPSLLGQSISEAVNAMGPFNAYMDNDRGRIWYEWRAEKRAIVLEVFNERVVGFYFE
jgi:hypothetical protein